MLNSEYMNHLIILQELNTDFKNANMSNIFSIDVYNELNELSEYIQRTHIMKNIPYIKSKYTLLKIDNEYFLYLGLSKVPFLPERYRILYFNKTLNVIYLEDFIKEFLKKKIEIITLIKDKRIKYLKNKFDEYRGIKCNF